MAEGGRNDEITALLESLELSEGDCKNESELWNKTLSPEEKTKRDLWELMQEELKMKLVESDSDEVLSWCKEGNPYSSLHHIGGVDISFDKARPPLACAMLTILSFPSLEVLHSSSAMVEMTEPYIPGFLAFREVGFLVDQLESVRKRHPNLTPQVILVDGNGVLHPRGFGLACHLGVLSGIPCVGVGKKLFHVDGLEKGPAHKEKNKQLLRKGDHFMLRGDSGRVWGAAVRTSDDAANPVYISVGHKISLETAIDLIVACSLKRVPEPIRQADIQSREIIRTQNTTINQK